MRKIESIKGKTDIVNILITLMVIPILTILMIYIKYSSTCELMILDNSFSGKIYSLSTHSDFFVSTNYFSDVIKNIVYYSVLLIQIIFHIIILVRFITAIQQRFSLLIRELMVLR